MAKDDSKVRRSEPSSSVAQWAGGLITRISKSFFGNRPAVEFCLITLLCRGHILIEDLPGTGKTVLARAFAHALGGRFRQIQCTPDLLPADILGVSVYHQPSGTFRFHEGPIMTNTLLVDEINRATPRTQSALLEAMAEGQVSVESHTMKLPDPFFLVATQSPLESEGTFPLPEVQKDRFFLSLRLGYPTRADERRVMADWTGRANRETNGGDSEQATAEVRRMQESITKVYVSDAIQDYLLALIERTRRDRRLLVGVSPRGSLALYKGSQAIAAIAGRDWVTPEDVKRVTLPVLANRILLRPDQVARGLTSAAVVDELLSSVAVPGYE